MRKQLAREKTRERSFLLFFKGGVGSVAAEMLTRCGIGKLLMFDYDSVELANMNRLFFTPDQAGQTKTDAARETLSKINPDVEFEAHTYNICLPKNFDHFMDRLQHGGKTGGPVDLVLGCVDNFEARTSINIACLELGMSWFESGVSENAVSGHIQFIVPGVTACFQCAPPLIVATGVDERTLKREGVCAASLPTTMAITAGCLVQNALKKLLKFGSVSNFVGYDALNDFFPRYTLKPNPECDNRHCREWAIKRHGVPAEAVSESTVAEAAVVHEDGDQWGIEVEPEDEPAATAVETKALADVGLVRKYEASKAQVDDRDKVVVAEDESLDDLAAQLKGL